jgi:putative transposase
MKARRFPKARESSPSPKECEAGTTGKDLGRRHGISADAVSRTSQVRRYAGVLPDGASSLEQENARLKRLVADLTLDRESLKELLGKTGKAPGFSPVLLPSVGPAGWLACIGR